MIDFLEVVHATEVKEDWVLRGYMSMMDIVDLTKDFASIRFWHFSRKMNMAAHDLVKLHFKFDVDCKHFDSFLDWLIGFFLSI